MRNLVFSGMVSLANAQMLVSTNNQQSWTYDYANNGTDWKNITLDSATNYCAVDEFNQSPVNLMTPIFHLDQDGVLYNPKFNLKQWSYQNPIDQHRDEHSHSYSDVGINTNLQTLWDQSRKVPLDSSNYFTSQVAVDEYGASTNKFNAHCMKFKSPSEHTIDKKHYDMELQIYHEGETTHYWSDWGIKMTSDENNMMICKKEVNGTEQEVKCPYRYDQKVPHYPIHKAAVSILFSVEDYDKHISDEDRVVMQTFLDQMRFTTNFDSVQNIINPTVDPLIIG